MAEVILSRSLLVDVPTHTPEMGWVKADYEMVTGIETPGHHISLYGSWQSNEVAQLQPIRQDMPLRMAKRLLDFCDLTFCANNADYDCHAFTGFLMEWQYTVTAGSSALKRACRAIKDFDNTMTNRPYVAYAPNSFNPYAHSFVGTERRGYGLSVAGPGMPLVISRALDLRRTFGVSKLFIRKH